MLSVETNIKPNLLNLYMSTCTCMGLVLYNVNMKIRTLPPTAQYRAEPKNVTHCSKVALINFWTNYIYDKTVDSVTTRCELTELVGLYLDSKTIIFILQKHYIC